MAKAMGVVTGHLPEVERPMAFVKALVDLQKACGVDGLKMSDYGITKEDMAKCAANARHTMGGLFELESLCAVARRNHNRSWWPPNK